MKKIFGLTIAAILIMALVGGGTYAYFSDTETSVDNTLTAGTLDLQVGTEGGYADDPVTTFSAGNIKPGDTGVGVTTLNNNGSLSGMLAITTSNTTNTAGVGTEFSDGSGDLGAAAEMAVYIDVNQNGAFNDGIDIGLNTSPGIYTAGPLVYATVNSYALKTWSTLEIMATLAQDDLRVAWRLPSGTGNNVQGDSVAIDFTFTLDQQ